MSIDFENELNPAQLAAVRQTEGPVLVIAGAGSGKTRTIVYRLAHLSEMGIPPENILLLTFTRKASQEMLRRAELILGHPLTGAGGGTFHSFAFQTLRIFGQHIGLESGFTLMDRSDSEGVIKEIRSDLNLGKGDKSFPKKGTMIDLVTKSRNKELSLDQVVENEASHLAPYVEDLDRISRGYENFKNQHRLMDYDDLLFKLEELLRENDDLRHRIRDRHQYIMVDEYQDTNLVQARIVRLLAGEQGNVMAVGDDAQSIYAFRGANVANILQFPRIFKDTKIIRLEQNYRSVQPVLDMTNAILENAVEKFDKNLFSDRKEGPIPRIVHPMSDQTQANLVLNTISDLALRYPLHEIAVLFRAGYHSYPLEVALKRMGMAYQKFGGLRFHEAAHIKDALCYAKLLQNPFDYAAWQRAMDPIKGIGPKTVRKFVEARQENNTKYIDKLCKKHPELSTLLSELDDMRTLKLSPKGIMDRIMAMYTPILTERYPDDYPRRQAGLEQLVQISNGYRDLEEFLADLTLDGDQEEMDRYENKLVLSTVHSAKGLEWDAVIIIDLVEDRFPSKKSLTKPEDLEEERRLLYVACTRARNDLYLFVPTTIYNRYSGSSEVAMPSPFIRELPSECYKALHESYTGGLNSRDKKPREEVRTFKLKTNQDDGNLPPDTPKTDPSKLGFCKHKIFGQGKIIAEVPPNKYRVNFPGFGLKVIVGDYLEML